MAVQTVFSNNLDPAQENLTARFTNATGFYIDAPLTEAEIEIDVFLQVYFPTNNGEQVRNLPLGKIEEQSILLNVTDTQSLVTIPHEYVDLGLEMALLFLASSTIFLEVYVIVADCTLCSVKSELETRLAEIETAINQILLAIDSNTSQPEPEPIETISQPATPENFFIFI